MSDQKNMTEDVGGGDLNGALMSDPVDVIIDKLLRYVTYRLLIAVMKHQFWG